MRILLTDHIARDKKYEILKDTEVEVQYIHLEKEDEQACKGQGIDVLQRQPVCAYVRKLYAQWCIKDLPQGEYPIMPKKAPWFVDSGRAVPRLRITRKQLPLTPSFYTVHSLKGMDKDRSAVDVNVRYNGSEQTCYVGQSRAKARRAERGNSSKFV